MGFSESKLREARSYFNSVILAAQFDLEATGQSERLPELLRAIGKAPDLSVPGLIQTRLVQQELPKFGVKLSLLVDISRASGIKILPVALRNGMHRAFRTCSVEPNDINSFFMNARADGGFDNPRDEWPDEWRWHLLSLSEMTFEDIFAEFRSVAPRPTFFTEEQARAVLAVLKEIRE